MIPLPIRDDNPRSRFPVVTLAIIVTNALVWFWEVSLGGPDSVGRAACALGAVPAWVLHGISEGYLYLPRIGAVPCEQAISQPWTILTSMFTHGSWLHIIGNMWFLWIFGDNIEDAMGRPRYVVFYLLCGVIAALTQILSTPNSTVPMVGASGAIAGVLGGYLLLFPRARIRCLWILIIFITTIELPAWLLLGLWFVSQFFLQPGSGVAAMAHVGGFIAGLGLVRLFVKRRPIQPRRVVSYEQ